MARSSAGWGRLHGCVDARAAWTLGEDDPDAPSDPSQRLVLAAVLITHDVTLDFVLREILPAFLPDPERIRPGQGPGDRRYQEAMADLPPVTLVHDAMASAAIDTVWRPPNLDHIVWSEDRRLHAKVGLVLTRSRTNLDESPMLSIIAGSTNLTRRAFTTNLEVVATLSVSVDTPDHNLLQARSFLSGLGAQHAGIESSPAVRVIQESLAPAKRPRAKRKADDPLFCHSLDPDAFTEQIAAHLKSAPKGCGQAQRILLASPFWPTTGTKLKSYLMGDCGVEPHTEAAIGLAVDLRGAQASTNDTTGHGRPPQWLIDHPQVTLFSPAHVALGRDDQGQAVARSRGQPGRPLHAKVMAIAYVWKYNAWIWRVVSGSANLTEHGLGLAGRQSNIEACWIDTIAEGTDGLDEWPLANNSEGKSGPEGPVLVPLSGRDLPEPTKPVKSADLQAEQTWRRLLRPLTQPDGMRVINAYDSCTIKIDDPGLGPEAVVTLGTGPAALVAERIGNTWVIDCMGKPPTGWCVVITRGDRRTVLPLPRTEVTVAVLMQHSVIRNRADRLLEYWLGYAPINDGSEPLDGDGTMESVVTGAGAAGGLDDRPLGSWRLNRILQRFAAAIIEEKLPRTSPADLQSWFRFQDLVDEIAAMDPVSRGYAGAIIEGCCLGWFIKLTPKLSRRKERLQVARKDAGWLKLTRQSLIEQLISWRIACQVDLGANACLLDDLCEAYARTVLGESGDVA